MYYKDKVRGRRRSEIKEKTAIIFVLGIFIFEYLHMYFSILIWTRSFLPHSISTYF